jgi:hypothetical protein
MRRACSSQSTLVFPQRGGKILQTGGLGNAVPSSCDGPNRAPHILFGDASRSTPFRSVCSRACDQRSLLSFAIGQGCRHPLGIYWVSCRVAGTTLLISNVNKWCKFTSDGRLSAGFLRPSNAGPLMESQIVFYGRARDFGDDSHISVSCVSSCSSLPSCPPFPRKEGEAFSGCEHRVSGRVGGLVR